MHNDNKNSQNTNNQGKDGDRIRSRKIYKLLLDRFAVYNTDGKINFSQTAVRFGQQKQGGSEFVKRMWHDVYDPTYDKKPSVLTLGKLIDILTAINMDIISTSDKVRGKSMDQLIRPEEVSSFIQKLVEPSTEEAIKLRTLGLDRTANSVLTKQILINMNSKSPSKEAINQLYSTFIDAIHTSSELSNDNDLSKIIEDEINNTLRFIKRDAWHINTPDPVKRLRERIIQEKTRIEVQSGAKKLDPEKTREGLKSAYSRKYFTDYFVRLLSRSVIENEMLANDYPVSIQHISINRSNPLPLSTEESIYGNISLLNSSIIRKEKMEEAVRTLEIQHVYEISVHCCIKEIPHDIKNSRLFQIYARNYISDDRLNFSLESSGLGGSVSQIIRVINKILLQDIPSLEKYFYTAHDIIINQEIIGNNAASPAWAHNLVQLCRIDRIEQILKSEDLHDTYEYTDVWIEEVAQGNYCGFDLIESIAKSAFFARLRAIKQIGTSSRKYMTDLCEKVIKDQLYKKGMKLLRSYPFCLRAMTNFLEESILKSEKESLSQFYLGSGLEIAWGYLEEGKYNVAIQRLKDLNDKFSLEDCTSQASNLLKKKGIKTNTENDLVQGKSQNLISGSMLAKYEICWAYCYYYSSLESNRESSKELFSCKQIGSHTIPESPREFITFSLACLDKAEDHLLVRQLKSHVIKEISQSTLSPFHAILAEIYLLRGKICLYFPKQIESIDSRSRPAIPSDYHYARISMFERARLYSAMSGEVERYSCITAYQSWAYIVAAYFTDNKQCRVLYNDFNLNKEKCFEWADRLLKHALVSYIEPGRRYYHQIKEMSGFAPDEETSYEGCVVKKIRPIQETSVPDPDENSFKLEESKGLQGLIDDKVLRIDMSLLCDKEIRSGESIYLYGVNACILLFVQGIYDLCNDRISTQETRVSWNNRIRRADRYFNYAWGIAEEGCEEIMKKENGNDYISRKHDFRLKENENLYPRFGFPEVESIIGLYPHKISEISDMGKIFSCVCNILHLYTSIQEAERKHFEEVVKYHLATLNILDIGSSKHLEKYRRKAHKLISNELNHALSTEVLGLDLSDLINKKEELVKEIFHALYSD